MSYLEIKMICENDENDDKTQEVSGEDRSETNYFKNKSKKSILLIMNFIFVN